MTAANMIESILRIGLRYNLKQAEYTGKPQKLQIENIVSDQASTRPIVYIALKQLIPQFFETGK